MPDERRYRLTDAAMQLHLYQASIGVEVSAERGDCRTLMLPTDIQHLDLISKG